MYITAVSKKGCATRGNKKNARLRPLQIQVISHSILGRLTRKYLRSTLLIDPDVPRPTSNRNVAFQKLTPMGYVFGHQARIAAQTGLWAAGS